MPILAAETSLYPADLLQTADDDDYGRRWWVVYTKARQEKALARQLVGYEVPFYLPLVCRERMQRGRRVRSFVPLFDGYVFVFGSDHERIRTLATNRISRVLPVDDDQRMRQDLCSVARLIEAGAPLTVESRLCEGAPVRVCGGALMGLEGVVIQRRGQRRLLVAVNYLQQGVSIELEDHLVEPR